ncbi:uncharacterized protein [Garra rufa]|uniref:uncharacterized protein isoform X1 n=1 Tax=Garra rufa TaxID=137080 RepID=UPI003CCEE4E2
MVSNKKKCPNCPQVMPCATKVCKACGAEQPKKARLLKRLQALDMKKGEWLGNLKKNHNEAAMRDEAIILLEKLHAMGYKPLLLLQKEGNGKKTKITSLTPRCELDPLATQHLSKITAFYELVCAGWKASEDTVLTLTLTPCDEQGTSGEVGSENLVQEAELGGLVEEAELEGQGAGTEGLVEEAELEGPGVETEGLMEEPGLEGPGVETEGLMEEPGLEGLGAETEGLVEEAELEGPGVETEGLMEKPGLEGPAVESDGLVEEAGLEGPTVVGEGEIHLPKKGNSYSELLKLLKQHSAVFCLIRSLAVYQRVRLGRDIYFFCICMQHPSSTYPPISLIQLKLEGPISM